jgi:hypothetical protein
VKSRGLEISEENPKRMVVACWGTRVLLISGTRRRLAGDCAVGESVEKLRGSSEPEVEKCARGAQVDVTRNCVSIYPQLLQEVAHRLVDWPVATVYPGQLISF